MSTTNSYVLFVDDDQDDRDLILFCCTALHEAERARFLCSGEELLRFLATQKTQEDYPSLIVLDINMPGMNGAETLRRLKLHTQYRHIPVIIFSTGSNSHSLYTTMGAEAFCQKPFSCEQWQQSVAAFFARLTPPHT